MERRSQQRSPSRSALRGGRANRLAFASGGQRLTRELAARAILAAHDSAGVADPREAEQPAGRHEDRAYADSNVEGVDGRRLHRAGYLRTGTR